jgi:hypothetical protein
MSSKRNNLRFIFVVGTNSIILSSFLSFFPTAAGASPANLSSSSSSSSYPSCCMGSSILQEKKTL